MAATTAEVNNWIGRVSKNKQPARAARTSDRFGVVLCKTSTGICHICGFEQTKVKLK